MLRNPSSGERVWANYRYKAMPFQGCIRTVLLSNGRAKGPKNLLVRFDGHAEPVVMSGGHLNKYTDGYATNGLPRYAKRTKEKNKKRGRGICKCLKNCGCDLLSKNRN